MFYYLNLVRCSKGTKQLCHNARYFSFIHQNSVKRNGILNSFKRLKSSNLQNLSTAGEVVKPLKVKLKTSDLRRLLSLAKQEKWKIGGEWKFGWIIRDFATRWSLAGAIGCLIVSSAITMAVPFGLGKILDTIYSSEAAVDSAAAKEKLNQWVVLMMWRVFRVVERKFLFRFCLVLAGIFILGGLANFGRVYLFNNACKFVYFFDILKFK